MVTARSPRAVQRGQSVVVQPARQPGTHSADPSHGRDREESGPGTRTALNLADVTPATRSSRRRDCLAGLGGPTDRLDVMLEGLPESARPMKDGVPCPCAPRQRERRRPCGARRREELLVGGRDPRSSGWRPRYSCSPGIGHRTRLVGQQTSREPSCSTPTRRAEHFATASDRCGWRASLDLLDDPAQFVATHVARDIVVRPSSAFAKTRLGQGTILTRPRAS